MVRPVGGASSARSTARPADESPQVKKLKTRLGALEKATKAYKTTPTSTTLANLNQARANANDAYQICLTQIRGSDLEKKFAKLGREADSLIKSTGKEQNFIDNIDSISGKEWEANINPDKKESIIINDIEYTFDDLAAYFRDPEIGTKMIIAIIKAAPQVINGEGLSLLKKHSAKVSSNLEPNQRIITFTEKVDKKEVTRVILVERQDDGTYKVLSKGFEKYKVEVDGEKLEVNGDEAELVVDGYWAHFQRTGMSLELYQQIFADGLITREEFKKIDPAASDQAYNVFSMGGVISNGDNAITGDDFVDMAAHLDMVSRGLNINDATLFKVALQSKRWVYVYTSKTTKKLMAGKKEISATALLSKVGSENKETATRVICNLLGLTYTKDFEFKAEHVLIDDELSIRESFLLILEDKYQVHLAPSKAGQVQDFVFTMGFLAQLPQKYFDKGASLEHYWVDTSKLDSPKQLKDTDKFLAWLKGEEVEEKSESEKTSGSDLKKEYEINSLAKSNPDEFIKQATDYLKNHKHETIRYNLILKLLKEERYEEAIAQIKVFEEQHTGISSTKKAFQLRQSLIGTLLKEKQYKEAAKQALIVEQKYSQNDKLKDQAAGLFMQATKEFFDNIDRTKKDEAALALEIRTYLIKNRETFAQRVKTNYKEKTEKLNEQLRSKGKTELDTEIKLEQVQAEIDSLIELAAPPLTGQEEYEKVMKESKSTVGKKVEASITYAARLKKSLETANNEQKARIQLEYIKLLSITMDYTELETVSFALLDAYGSLPPYLQTRAKQIIQSAILSLISGGLYSGNLATRLFAKYCKKTGETELTITKEAITKDQIIQITKAKMKHKRGCSELDYDLDVTGKMLEQLMYKRKEIGDKKQKISPAEAENMAMQLAIILNKYKNNKKFFKGLDKWSQRFSKILNKQYKKKRNKTLPDRLDPKSKVKTLDKAIKFVTSMLKTYK